MNKKTDVDGFLVSMMLTIGVAKTAEHLGWSVPAAVLVASAAFAVARGARIQE